MVKWPLLFLVARGTLDLPTGYGGFLLGSLQLAVAFGYTLAQAKTLG
jgi:hypothetical protein